LLTVISNIEYKAFTGAKLVRAAGSSALLFAKDGNKALIKLRSG